MSFCYKVIEVAVESGWTHKMIKVRCGNTSPHGSPWMCDACAKKNEGRDWRREAELDGEQWDEDY
jgi:hypothetical protein